MRKEDRWKRAMGACVRSLRLHRGWTQEELATRLRESGFRRCSRVLVSQIEVGLAAMRAHEIYYLRQVFGESFEREFWQPYHGGSAGTATTEGVEK